MVKSVDRPVDMHVKLEEISPEAHSPSHRELPEAAILSKHVLRRSPPPCP